MHNKASNFGVRINIHSSFFLYRTQLGESSENSSVYSKPGTFQSIGLKVQATGLDQTLLIQSPVLVYQSPGSARNSWGVVSVDWAIF
jgi:hypothetical protein